MDIDVSADAKDKRLNRLVAITVVLLSVVMGLGNIKDGNIVQAMAQAQSNAVDRWGEYQAARTKKDIVETAAAQLVALGGDPPAARLSPALKTFRDEAAHFGGESPGLRQQAQAFAAQYDALNVHDDQFDASEALISTAISVVAVAALVESFGVLWLGWLFGAAGMFMALCGFAGWAFHPDVLSNLLG